MFDQPPTIHDNKLLPVGRHRLFRLMLVMAGAAAVLTIVAGWLIIDDASRTPETQWLEAVELRTLELDLADSRSRLARQMLAHVEDFTNGSTQNLLRPIQAEIKATQDRIDLLHKSLPADSLKMVALKVSLTRNPDMIRHEIESARSGLDAAYRRLAELSEPSAANPEDLSSRQQRNAYETNLNQINIFTRNYLEDLQAELDRRSATTDEAIAAEYRTLDRNERAEYFHLNARANRMRYVLAGSLAWFIILVGLAFVAGRPAPAPDHVHQETFETATGRNRFGVAMIASFVATLGVWALVAGLTPRINYSDKPTSAEVPSWAHFRGPGGFGVAPGGDWPVSWNSQAGENILWKAEVRLPGFNSPVIWGNKIYLTGATEHERAVLCFDADTGQFLWEAGVFPDNSPTDLPVVSEDTGYAAPSAAVDATGVYAIFANGDIGAFDHDGNELWSRALGLPDNHYGHASSLVVFEGRVIVQWDQNADDVSKSELIALDTRTGNIIWRKPRPEVMTPSWSSPIIIDAGQPQIVTCTSPWVFAYDPRSGNLLWKANILGGEIGPSPTWANGLVYVCNTNSNLAAIRPEGTGDVTSTHIAWKRDDADLPDTTSPVTDGKYLYLTDSYGRLHAFDAKTGASLWSHEFEDIFKASPTIAGNHLYLVDEKGVGFVLEVGPENKMIATCPLGEKVSATPAFLGNRIYIRGEKNLYCIGEGGNTPANSK